MALRLIEVLLPVEDARELAGAPGGEVRDGPWLFPQEEGRAAVRVLVDSEHDGDFLDDVERRFGSVPGYRVLVLPVQATLPRPEPEEEPGPPESPWKRPATKNAAISREELYAEVETMATPGGVYLVTALLSTLVAAFGLLRDNQAVIIGAMVIAPLLGPTVAVALAVCLGDPKLLHRAARANAMGFAVAVGVSALLGLLLGTPGAGVEIARRTGIHEADLVVALASGAAGAIALTTRVAISLVGVMVAVSLLPPASTLGLLLGSGRHGEVGGAMLLLATNVVAVVLAAVVTFRLQGIRPRSWWREERARRASRLALIIGIVLLLVFAGLIVLAGAGATTSPTVAPGRGP